MMTLELINTLAAVGTLVVITATAIAAMVQLNHLRQNLIDEDVYFELGNPARYWTLIEPAIALYRRRRGLQTYENFEYLVIRDRLWSKAHADGTFPRNQKRIDVEDPYLAIDHGARARS